MMFLFNFKITGKNIFLFLCFFFIVKAYSYAETYSFIMENIQDCSVENPNIETVFYNSISESKDKPNKIEKQERHELVMHDSILSSPYIHSPYRREIIYRIAPYSKNTYFRDNSYLHNGFVMNDNGVDFFYNTNLYYGLDGKKHYNTLILPRKKSKQKNNEESRNIQN